MSLSNSKSARVWLLVAALGGCHDGGTPTQAESDAMTPSAAAGSGAPGAFGAKPTTVSDPQTPSKPSNDVAVAPNTEKPSGQQPPVAAAMYALAKVSTCDDAEQKLRDAAIAEMNAQLDTNLANYLRSGGFCVYPTAALPANSGPTSAPAPSKDASAPSAGPTAVSTTNNQVASVDEADFIKNDDHYIYQVGKGALRVLEAWPAASTHEVGRIALDGTPLKLFVAGDRAVVYVSVPRNANANTNASSKVAGSGAVIAGGSSACTYGYGCTFSGDGTDTGILLFDVTDRTAPKLLHRYDINSSLIAARRIDNAVHTVVAKLDSNFGVKLQPDTLRSCMPLTDQLKDQAKTEFEKLRKDNIALIQNKPLADMLPSLRVDGTATEPSCDAIYRAADSGSAFTSLVSFDMSKSEAPGMQTIISRPGAVYASESSLYIAVPQAQASNQPWFDALPNEKEASTLHAFRIGKDPKASAYLGSGVVKGRVLNQFSMDEYQGNLRIATTTGHLPSPDAHNTLSVLTLQEGRLQQQGLIDHIAPSEDIRSVRFDGERGFMVTFKKTDPLFAFDLKDPKAPKLLGELMIPGFSTYIHMLDDKHLLTIGYDADDHGDFAFFDGVILQIFDVSDPKHLALQHKAIIGTRGSSSEALADHLAFTLFQGKLALPMTICEGGGDGTYGTNMTFSGLIVYDVSVEKGFSERGRVANPPTPSGQYDHSLCSNWWSNASSEVKRSLFMDDFVYAVSANGLHVQDTRAMGKDVATVVF